MHRSLTQIIAELPTERQQRIKARYQDLKQDVENRRDYRQTASEVQIDFARAVTIKQPSGS